MGNTFDMHLALMSSQDHPHIHGEYQSDADDHCGPLGSPPHTWGILIGKRLVNPLLRITPTYMGNTMPNALSNYTNQDHPHIHGEYVYLDNLEAGDIGSPPHTWGILQLISARSIQLGITPTYMGNTFIFHQLPDTNEDHPHIHGEYQFKKRLVKTAMGSPPHTWGIPARLVWVATRAQDHPHIHGEYSL